MKKAQVTPFVIVGVVLLLLVGIGMINIQTNKNSELSDQISFSGSGSIPPFVEECLSYATIESVNYYGLSSIPDLQNSISALMHDCTNDFSYFKDYGIEVKEEPPSFEVAVNDENVVVMMNYPLSIVDNGKETNLEDFSYTYKTSAIVRPQEGIIQKDYVFQASDGIATLKFNQDTKVSIKDSDNTVSFVSLSVRDKKYNGMENGVVIGNTLYEGLPSGAVFDPPLDFSVNLESINLAGINPKTLRLAYFDDTLGYWIAYPTTYDSTSNTLIGEVSHFSLIAITVCAQDNKEERGNMVIPMMYAFKDPFANDYCEPTKWKLNDATLGGGLGIHIMPEYMKDLKLEWETAAAKYEEITDNPSTDDTNVMEMYDTQDNTGRLDITKGIFDPDHFKDWDNDDTIDETDSLTFEWTVTNEVGETLNANIAPALNQMETVTCMKKCSSFAGKEIQKKFSWLPKVGNQPTIDVTLLTGAKNLINIKDSSPIYCLANVKDERSDKSAAITKFTETGISLRKEIECNEELILNSYNNLKTEPMEGTSGFFATPDTYGFISPQNEYTGVGKFSFTIADDNSCMDLTSASLIVEQDARNSQPQQFATVAGDADGFTVTNPLTGLDFAIGYTLNDIAEQPRGIQATENDNTKKQFIGWGCSDVCKWYINQDIDATFSPSAADTDAGKLISGSNVVTVVVDNTQDACLYAKGYLDIVGTGIVLEAPNSEAGCKALDSCWLNNQCTLRGHENGGACCCGPGEGKLGYGYPHWESGDCFETMNVMPRNEEECKKKSGCWVPSSSTCVPNGYYDGTRCCMGLVNDGNGNFIDQGYQTKYSGTAHFEGDNAAEKLACFDLRNDLSKESVCENCKLLASECSEGLDYSKVCTDRGYCCYSSKQDGNTQCSLPNSCTSKSVCEASGGTEVLGACSNNDANDHQVCCSAALAVRKTCNNDGSYIYDDNINNADTGISKTNDGKAILEFCDEKGCEIVKGDVVCKGRSVSCKDTPNFNYDGSKGDITWKCEGGKFSDGICGDGKLNLGEQCDIGSLDYNKGCNWECKITSEWACTSDYLQLSICNKVPHSQSDAKFADGKLESGSACDTLINPGTICNSGDTSGCNERCTGTGSVELCINGQYIDQNICNGECNSDSSCDGLNKGSACTVNGLTGQCDNCKCVTCKGNTQERTIENDPASRFDGDIWVSVPDTCLGGGTTKIYEYYCENGVRFSYKTWDCASLNSNGHVFICDSSVGQCVDKCITEMSKDCYPSMPDTCFNNVKDSDESEVDCGGPCIACPTCEKTTGTPKCSCENSDLNCQKLLQSHNYCANKWHWNYNQKYACSIPIQ